MEPFAESLSDLFNEEGNLQEKATFTRRLNSEPDGKKPISHSA